MSNDGAKAGRSGERRLILNPKSGTADHVERIREFGAEQGYEIEETRGEEHAVALARAAAEDRVDLLAVAGGDGTLNEVVRGLEREGGLGATAVGILPTGTENIFATNVGVEDLEQGFEVLESGERRTIDVGVADGRAFLTSCIAGLPADASIATSGELKERLGSLAFAITGVREAASFDGLHLDLTSTENGEETQWTGEALCALVGNVRRFVKEGGQANAEDGLFEIVIIEQMSTGSIVAEASAQRLFGRDTEHVYHKQASEVRIGTSDGEDVNFSLDGEAVTHDELTVHVEPRALTVLVGPGYDPDPVYASDQE